MGHATAPPTMSPTLDQLRTACTTFSLDASGDEQAMRARLGSFLVDRLFSNPSTTPSTSSEDEAPARRDKRPLSASAAAWHAFARKERALVKEGLGLTDPVAVIKEVAARYKRAKLVGSSSEPLMLNAPSDETCEGIKTALRELPHDEIKTALSAHGIEADVVDLDANIETLARALL